MVVMATINPKLLALSKLGRATTSKLGLGTTVGGNPKEYQRIEGNLHSEVSSDRPHAQDEMLIA